MENIFKKLKYQNGIFEYQMIYIKIEHLKFYQHRK